MTCEFKYVTDAGMVVFGREGGREERIPVDQLERTAELMRMGPAWKSAKAVAVSDALRIVKAMARA